MAGQKLFIDNTGYHIDVTLYIRKSSNPINQAGTKDFSLNNGQSLWVTYGDNINIYLNGFMVTAVHDGEIVAQQEIIVTRGSPLDNALNMDNTVTFTFDGQSFHISTRNSY